MNITAEAKEKIISHLTKRNEKTKELTNLLRIGVKTTGCSGYAYVLEYADTINEEDTEHQYESFSIVIDKKSEVYLHDIEVGYAVEELSEGFTFMNPLEKARCGCGESFTV